MKIKTLITGYNKKADLIYHIPKQLGEFFDKNNLVWNRIFDIKINPQMLLFNGESFKFKIVCYAI